MRVAKEVIDLVSDCCIGEAYRAMPMASLYKTDECRPMAFWG